MFLNQRFDFMEPTRGHIGCIPIGKNQAPSRLVNTADIIKIDEKTLIGPIQFRVLIGDIFQESGKLNELTGGVHRHLVGRLRGRHKVDITHR